MREILFRIGWYLDRDKVWLGDCKKNSITSDFKNSPNRDLSSILLWGRRWEAPRVHALSIFCDSGIIKFMVSLDLFTQPIFETELLDNLIT